MKVATHNMFRKLDPDQWRADLDKSCRADVTAHQEASGKTARATLSQYCAEHSRGLRHPTIGANVDTAISWDNAMYDPVLTCDVPGASGVGEPWFGGAQKVHLAANQMTFPNAKAMPARFFTYQGLYHKELKQRHLVFSIHPVAGATDPTPEERPEIEQWADWGLAQYFLDIVAFTATEMSRNVSQVDQPLFWDAIILAGDFNAYMDNFNRWYYPARMLDSLYLPDSLLIGLDHIMLTRGSDLKPGNRTSMKGHTDHRIHFAEFTKSKHRDYPPLHPKR